MSWKRSAVLGALALLTVIGAIDAGMSREWDLFVLFVLAALLILPLTTSLDRRRRQVTLRADLARWTDLRAGTTGESAGAIIDRAVARHRERLEPDDHG